MRGTVVRRIAIHCIIGALAFVCAAPWTLAQTYPQRPIRLVAPYPPGGADISARLLAPRMADDLGQPMVIDNRPGANGNIGSVLVSHAAPDGYTLLYITASTNVTGVAVSKVAPFDPIKDFTPIVILSQGLSLVVVPATLPIKSIQELIDHAKRNPRKLSYGSSGNGSSQHLDAEVLKLGTATDIVHVPYKGFGQTTQALLSGEVQLAFITLQAAKGMVTAGRVRVLALGEEARSDAMPGVPALSELLPGFKKSPQWHAIMGPPGMPRERVMRINATAVKAVTSPAIVARYREDGAQVIASTPEEFAVTLKSELERMTRLVKTLGIELE
jgi:tripartite-type tricarboxylate transporter receptor subunit TctC